MLRGSFFSLKALKKTQSNQTQENMVQPNSRKHGSTKLKKKWSNQSCWCSGEGDEAFSQRARTMQSTQPLFAEKTATAMQTGQFRHQPRTLNIICKWRAVEKNEWQTQHIILYINAHFFKQSFAASKHVLKAEQWAKRGVDKSQSDCATGRHSNHTSAPTCRLPLTQGDQTTAFPTVRTIRHR